MSGEEGLGLFGGAIAQSCSNRVGFYHLDLLGVALRSQLRIPARYRSKLLFPCL